MLQMLGNLIKYVPRKSYKKFASPLKKVYGAPSLASLPKSV